MKKGIIYIFLLIIISCDPYDEYEDHNHDYKYGLYVYDVESTQKTKIEIDSMSAIQNYDISQNGKTIVYTTYEKTMLYNMETDEDIQILDWVTYDFSISPSGNNVAIATHYEGRLQIYLFSLSDLTWTTVMSDSLEKWNVRFASDTTIYFISGMSDIYKLNLSNNSITPILLGNPGSIYYYWISSTETLLYRRHKTYYSEDVFLYTPTQDSAVWITSTSGLNDMDFFADNDSIIFDMLSGSERDIFTMSVNGGEKIKWTDDASDDYDPSISSSGEYIVYKSVIGRENRMLKLINKTTKEVTIFEDTDTFDGWIEKPRFIPNTSKIIYIKAIADEE